MTIYYVMLDTNSVTTSSGAGVDHPLHFYERAPQYFDNKLY